MNTSNLTAMALQAGLIFAASAMFGGAASAQAPTEAGAIEVAGTFGAAANLPDLTSGTSAALNQISSGFTVSGGSSFKWFVGGTVGYAVSPNLLLVLETNYNRIGSVKVSYGSGSSATSINESSSLTDFTGGVHWQIPVSSSKFVPYLSAGVGGTRIGASASGGGVAASVSASETDLTINGGGGVRIYIGPGWGIRPQIEAVHIPGQNYIRYGVGVFWQSKHK